ncbi:MAG: Holliday junction resolvase RuvX [Candidatus Dasytiphilus stammeri]
MTILAFDFGTKSIGVAIGQTITQTANPLPAVQTRFGNPDWLKIKALISEWHPDKIIVGLPINMDGSEQSVTKSTRIFAHGISKRFNIATQLHDERMTTIEARDILFKLGGFRALKKIYIDSMAAVLILESCFQIKLISNINLFQ